MTGPSFGDRFLQSGSFKKSEIHYHSTFKEILAVKYDIQKFKFYLAHKSAFYYFIKNILFYFILRNGVEVGTQKSILKENTKLTWTANH
jgi:hypothetical protein